MTLYSLVSHTPLSAVCLLGKHSVSSWPQCAYICCISPPPTHHPTCVCPGPGLLQRRAKPDMIAYSQLKEELTPAPRHGHVAGIPPGFEMWGRGEMAILGLHSKIVAGIDSAKDVEGAYAICMSGGYKDDEDEGAVFWYTGEGGQGKAGSERGKQVRVKGAEQGEGWVAGRRVGRVLTALCPEPQHTTSFCVCSWPSHVPPHGLGGGPEYVYAQSISGSVWSINMHTALQESISHTSAVHTLSAFPPVPQIQPFVAPPTPPPPPQVSDQEFTRGNLALQQSHDKQRPVRVFRSKAGEQRRYVYEGLYWVVEAVRKPSRDGPLVSGVLAWGAWPGRGGGGGGVSLRHQGECAAPGG
jgi:hypothetical protein